jgi:uncharacterized protein (TIGR03435 family)
MGRRVWQWGCAAILATSLAAAQQQPAFEAASVKPNTDPNPRGVAFQILPSGRVHFVHLPLYIIISLSYDLPFQSRTERLSGGPDWVKSEAYDIEATAGAGAFPPAMTSEARRKQMKLMLRTLLAERFHLQVQRSDKEMPVYTLVVAKGGPKLTPAKVQEADCMTALLNPPCHEVNGGIGRGLHGKAITIADAAYYAGNWSDRPILDRTGLDGLYEIDTEGWAPMEVRPPDGSGAPPSAEALAMADPARPTLFVIMDRLGLKLEPAKGPVDFYVIEHIERPGEN